MTTNNRLIDLRSNECAWSRRPSLPDRLVLPDGRSLEAVSLPSGSLCADFLATPDNTWAGISVAVHPSDIPSIWSAYSECSPRSVKLINPQSAQLLPRYRSFPGMGWIEVLWLDDADLTLVQVQTLDVLWYALYVQTAEQKIMMMGLEDIARLVTEPETPLRLPIDWRI